jgi:hypothetical protein
MPHVSKTLSAKNYRFSTLKLKNVHTQFQKISVGVDGNIRTSDTCGKFLTSELPETLVIDGCDWKGALSIWLYLNPYHSSICEEGVFYYAIPPECTSPDVEGFFVGDEIVSTVFFHHLYNILSIKNPLITPSFRSPIERKYSYMQTMLIKNDPSIFINTNETLDAVLNEIQTTLKTFPYSSWLAICELFSDLPGMMSPSA